MTPAFAVCLGRTGVESRANTFVSPARAHVPRAAHRRRAVLARRPRVFSCAGATAESASPRAGSGVEALQVPDPFEAGRGAVVCPAVGWKVTGTEGAAAIARSRGIDFDSLSRAYGMVLAQQMLELGVGDLLPECVVDGIRFGWDDLDSPMDVAHFETLMQKMLPEKSGGGGGLTDEQKDVREMFAMSQMYGFLLGTTLRMSCLELDVELVEGGFRAKSSEPTLELPMSGEEYDRMFMEVQQIAAALMFDANKKDAGAFFGVARAADDVEKLDSKGNVLCLYGSRRAPESEPSATAEDEVIVVIAGRLLDGRAFLVPTYSDGVDKEADSVRIPLAGVPENLSIGIEGMRVGEVRTVYLHPDASEGISTLFSTQPFPPQTVIIFDFKLVKIMPKQSEGEESD